MFVSGGLRKSVLLFLAGGITLFAAAAPAFAQSDTRALAKEALQKALQAVEKDPLAGDRSALNRRAVILMSRIDPQAALPLVIAVSRASDAICALGEVAVAIAPQDKQKAQQLLLQATKTLRDVNDEDQRTAELAFLCRQTGRIDPSAAFLAARGITDPKAFEATWQSLARIAPEAALADYKKATPFPLGKELLAGDLLPLLAPVNLPEALLLSDDISDTLKKSQALAEASFALPPAPALGVAQRIPEEALRQLALRAVAERSAATDLPAALAEIPESGPEGDSARAALALRIAGTDLPRAKELIAGIALPEVRRDAWGLLLEQLSESNSPAARELADNPEIPSWALPAFCGALAKTDPAAAFSRADKISQEKLRSLALAGVAKAAVASSPKLAEEILLEVAPEDRLPALRELVTSLASQSLDKATGLIGLAPDAAQVHPLLLAIAERIAPQDPGGALRIAKAGPPSPDRTEVLLNIAVQLAPADMKQAMATAKEAVGQAGAGRALVGRLAKSNPSLAMTCANGIEAPYQRAWAFCDIAETLIAPPPQIAPLQRSEVQRVVETGNPPPSPSGAPAAGVEIGSAQPHRLALRLPGVDPEHLYTVRAKTAAGTFVWENLKPAPGGGVILQDDGHLQPAQRLRCPSRGMEIDPSFFDDFSKAQWQGKRRLPYGVPVSTFGGAGYLSTAPTWLERDSRGGFWLYQALRPWRVTCFDEQFNYRFTLVFPHAVTALTTDARGNVYVLEAENYLSRFDADGRPLNYWRLPEGYDAGEFLQASGIAADETGAWLYLGDEKLSRVQRFDGNMQLRPLPAVPWGWLGREDLSYLESGAYDENGKYLLDRPRRLALAPGALLYADCAYYLMRFNLATGEQVSFGSNGVLGWGGTFTDAPDSTSAAANAHWQDHFLSGIDRQGNIYISDATNVYLNNLRLQSFSPNGAFLEKYDIDREITSAAGDRIYLGPTLGMAFDEAPGGKQVWLAERGDRIYQSLNLTSGGRTYLGPGAPGRQFDLTQISSQDLTVEAQTAPLPRKAEGLLLAFPAGVQGTRNCEAERNVELAAGATTLWLPVRLGTPFKVTLFEEDRPIPESNYALEIETSPGVFGTCYDYFRVTNKSGRAWKNIRYLAETAAN
jgi:hypothetical protein